jgi:hypothetical protein
LLWQWPQNGIERANRTRAFGQESRDIDHRSLRKGET